MNLFQKWKNNLNKIVIYHHAINAEQFFSKVDNQ